MSFQIRAFRTEDYEEYTALENRVFTEYPFTADQIRFRDEKRDPKCKFARFVVVQDGNIIAAASYDQRIWSYHPQIFEISLVVPQSLRSSPVAEQLYKHVLNAIAPYNPIKLSTYFREDYEGFKEFFESHGFTETMRNWESRLDATKFDFGPYREFLESLDKTGITYLPLSQIPESEERNHVLHELETELGCDVPSEDPFTPITYAFFVERTLKNPDLWGDGYLLALDGDQYVGQSALWTSQGNDDLYTGLTGVRRSHRRRKIALALKLKTIEVARNAGYSLIKTWNASNNEGMLAINNQLGYIRQPPWIALSKKLKPKD